MWWGLARSSYYKFQQMTTAFLFNLYFYYESELLRTTQQLNLFYSNSFWAWKIAHALFNGPDVNQNHCQKLSKASDAIVKYAWAVQQNCIQKFILPRRFMPVTHYLNNLFCSFPLLTDWHLIQIKLHEQYNFYNDRFYRIKLSSSIKVLTEILD